MGSGSQTARRQKWLTMSCFLIHMSILVLVHWIVVELDSGSFHLAGGSAWRLFVLWHPGPFRNLRDHLGEAPQRPPKVQVAQWVQQYHLVGLCYALVGHCLNPGPFVRTFFVDPPLQPWTTWDTTPTIKTKRKACDDIPNRTFLSMLCSTFS